MQHEFKIRYDWLESFKELPDEDFKRLVLDIAEYQKNGGDVPEYTGSAKVIASFIFAQLKKRKKRGEINRNNINERWSKSKKEDYLSELNTFVLQNVYDCNTKNEKEKEREKENEKENEKEKVIQKEKDKEKAKEKAKEKESLIFPHTSEKSREGHEDAPSAKSILVKEIIDRLNQKAGTSFKDNTKSTVSYINARLKEGFSKEDFFTVIDFKCAEWRGSEMENYLRPMTLFSTKFEGYLNAAKRNMPSKNKYNDDIDDFFYEGE